MSEAWELDLAEVEFDRDDPGAGVAVTVWVDRLRELVARHGRVRVHECPQMLAHTLYKVGMLRDRTIELASVRDEEPQS